MAIAEQIKGVMEQKAALITKMESMMDSEKALDEGEQTAFDDLEKQVGDLDHRLMNLEKTEQLIAANKAKPVEPRTPGAVVTPQLDQDKTLHLAREVHSLYMAGGNRLLASQYAKETLGDELLSTVLSMPADVVQRATVIPGATGTSGWASQLIQINQANEAFIDMLRPMSVVARFPGRQMSFEGAGSIVIPRKTVGSTGGWVAEGDGIKVDRLTLDSVTLTPKKNANIIAVSNELLARSTPSAMQLVRDDILEGVAVSIDTKFVSADAASAGVSPAGLQTYDGTPTASAGDTLDNITTDLKAALGAMLAVNMPMVRPVWLINPARLNSLRFIRDGLGSYAFRAEIDSGTLVGYPFIDSTTVSSSVVMLVDASQIIVASELSPEITLSGDASLHMVDASVAEDIGGATTPVQSMFQTDSTAIRCTTRLDFGARYDECVQSITSVSW